MYCSKCGENIQNGDNFCANCGETVFVDSNVNMPQVYGVNKNITLENQKDKNVDFLCILSLVIGMVLPTLFNFVDGLLKSKKLLAVSNFLNSIIGLFSIAGLVLMIIIRVKYPKNKFGKILMWIYIVFFVLSFLVLFVTLLACFTSCYGCQ